MARWHECLKQQNNPSCGSSVTFSGAGAENVAPAPIGKRRCHVLLRVSWISSRPRIVTTRMVCQQGVDVAKHPQTSNWLSTSITCCNISLHAHTINQTYTQCHRDNTHHSSCTIMTQMMSLGGRLWPDGTNA